MAKGKKKKENKISKVAEAIDDLFTPNRYGVEITVSAYNKLRTFVELCPYEISGLGKVKLVRSGEFGIVPRIYDIEIFKQEVNSGHSTMDQETLAKFLYEKVAKGESPEDYKVWWHSHCNMEAYFSGTDLNTIGISKEFPWLISIVTNKMGNTEVRFDTNEPYPLYCKCTLQIVKDEDSNLEELCRKEIVDKVSVSEFLFPKNGKGETKVIQKKIVLPSSVKQTSSTQKITPKS